MYFLCERCEIEGERVESLMLFLSTSEPLRTDPVFNVFGYLDHQRGKNPLIKVGIRCVRQFPLDYMHLICLRVVRRILLFPKEGPRICRLSQNQIQLVSQCFVFLKERTRSNTEH